jgi:hypothetical protein
MKSTPVLRPSLEYLRSAQTRLICRVDPGPDSDSASKLTPYISDVELGWDEVLDEGYDPHHSPLGCPVYWRVVKRGDEKLYCSTFLATRAQVMKSWGTPGPAYCDPVTGMSVARVETNLLGDWTRINNSKLEEDLKEKAALRRIVKADPKIGSDLTTPITEMLKDERLLDLTSALKAVHGQKINAALPIFRHWARTKYDIGDATPKWREEVEEAYVKVYRLAKPIEQAEAIDFLKAYSKHFFKTANGDERAALATALGYSSLEFEIRSEGFSMRELMQALKIFDRVPEDLLTASFERYARDWRGHKLPVGAMEKLIALYRREPAMKSLERARTILKVFGVKLLNVNDPDDVQTWREVSAAREH